MAGRALHRTPRSSTRPRLRTLQPAKASSCARWYFTAEEGSLRQRCPPNHDGDTTCNHSALGSGHHARATIRPFRDRRLVDVEMLRHQLWRCVREPVSQRKFFIVWGTKNPDELQVGVADILDIM